MHTFFSVNLLPRISRFSILHCRPSLGRSTISGISFTDDRSPIENTLYFRAIEDGITYSLRNAKVLYTYEFESLLFEFSRNNWNDGVEAG